MKAIFRTLLLLLTFACSYLYAQPDSILFVGNSYTHRNSMITLFDNLSRSVGDTFYVEQIVKGGYTLESHVTDAVHVAKIQERKWNYVFLQDQSQVPTIDSYFNALSLPSASILDNYIKSQNSCAKTLFFMTWGRRFGGQQCDPGNNQCSVAFTDFGHMQDTLTSRYIQLAKSVDASVSPVGEAWRLALEDTTGLILHDGDGSHPNLLGSYLTACTHYASVTGRSPVGASYTAGLSPGWAGYLQRKAASAVLDNLQVYMIDGPAFPDFALEATTEWDIAQPACQPSQLEVVTQVTYTGRKSGTPTLDLALNRYSQSGSLMGTDTLSFHCPPRCTDTLLSVQQTVPLDSAFFTLTLDKLDPSDNSFSLTTDTVAAFSADRSLWDSASFYREPFTIQTYAFSHDLWRADRDLLSGSGWQLEADASTDLAQYPEASEGCALVSLRATDAAKWLISPCIELQAGQIYEIRFRHANHRTNKQSGLGFRFGMSRQANFSNPTLIQDFGIRYDSLFTQYVDILPIDISGLYFFGIEARGTMGAGLMGEMAIDDFQITNLGKIADPVSSIEGVANSIPNDLVSLYPNPASTYIQLELNQAIQAETRCYFVDMLGKDCTSEIREQGSLTFDVSRLNPGIYTLIVESQGVVVHARKFALVR